VNSIGSHGPVALDRKKQLPAAQARIVLADCTRIRGGQPRAAYFGNAETILPWTHY